MHIVKVLIVEIIRITLVAMAVVVITAVAAAVVSPQSLQRRPQPQQTLLHI